MIFRSWKWYALVLRASVTHSQARRSTLYTTRFTGIRDRWRVFCTTALLHGYEVYYRKKILMIWVIVRLRKNWFWFELRFSGTIFLFLTPETISLVHCLFASSFPSHSLALGCSRCENLCSSAPPPLLPPYTVCRWFLRMNDCATVRFPRTPHQPTCEQTSLAHPNHRNVH